MKALPHIATWMVALAACAASIGHAQRTDYPARPIRVIVPFVAGGGTDLLARLVSPKFGELTRRLGFEYNGMRLHEYYFDNMTPNGAELDGSSRLAAAIDENFGGFDAWKADFLGVGKMRGVGWAVLAHDPVAGKLSNHWITLHEEGNVAGFQPILVMDVWEHAFTVDYKPTERAKYIDAFYSNICWKTVGSRYTAPAA